jgi:hypothetical protein
MDRRSPLRTSLAFGGLAGLGACATTPQGRGALRNTAGLAIEDIPLAPVRAHPDRIFDVRACIRPFRVKGPNLDTEQAGDGLKLVSFDASRPAPKIGGSEKKR